MPLLANRQQENIKETHMKVCDFSTCSNTGSKQHETELKGKQDETRLESNMRAQK